MPTRTVDRSVASVAPPAVHEKLFAVTRELLAVINFDGYFETANPSWVDVLGWPIEELQSIPIWELIHPDDLPASIETAKRFTEEGGHLVEFSNRYRCKDGSYRHLSWTNYADVEEGRVYCVARDLTEIGGQSQELLKLFTLTDDLIAVGPGEGRYDIVSPSWTNVLGWSSDELMAMDVRTLIHPDDLPDALAESERIRANGSNSKKYGVRFRAKDGTYRRISWTAYAAPDNKRIYAIGRDTTELSDATENLDRQARSWEAFGYTLAHDVRSPTRSIAGLCEVLLRGVDNMDADHLRRCLGMIQDRATRVDQMATKLLAFAKGGASAVDDQEVDMQAAVLRQVDLLRETAGPEFRFTIKPLPKCRGDPTLIDVAVANLLQNACKFARSEDPGVTVSGDVEGGIATYHFEDTGIGFNAALAARIWEPMVRGNGASNVSGSGVGLATVKRVIERQGGSVTCTGTAGKGATFSFSLPA